MPASQLNNVGLTYNWETGENLWGDPLNSNLGKIDALLQSSVEDTITTLPGIPLDGQMWLVADSGTTGSLIGHENKLAIYYDGAFNFITPKEGWEISHKTKKTRLRRNSSNRWESAQSSFVTDNISTLITIPTPVLPTGKTVEIEVISYHPNWSGSSTLPSGGGRFVWDASKPKSQHNGGTIISPTVPWNGTQATHEAFLAGTGETQPSGNGCWVRTDQSTFVVSWFGARGDGVVDDTVAIQKVIDYASSAGGGRIYFPEGSYRTTAPIRMRPGITLCGSGRRKAYPGVFVPGPNTLSTIVADHIGRSAIRISGTTVDSESGQFMLDINLATLGSAGSVGPTCAIGFECGPNQFQRDFTFERVGIHGFVSACDAFKPSAGANTQMGVVKFINCAISLNTWIARTLDGTQWNNFVFILNEAGQNGYAAGTGGIDISAHSASVESNVLEGMRNPVRIFGGYRGISVAKNYFEANVGTACIELASVRGPWSVGPNTYLAIDDSLLNHKVLLNSPCGIGQCIDPYWPVLAHKVSPAILGADGGSGDNVLNGTVNQQFAMVSSVTGANYSRRPDASAITSASTPANIRQFNPHDSNPVPMASYTTTGTGLVSINHTISANPGEWVVLCWLVKHNADAGAAFNPYVRLNINGNSASGTRDVPIDDFNTYWRAGEWCLITCATIAGVGVTSVIAELYPHGLSPASGRVSEFPYPTVYVVDNVNKIIPFVDNLRMLSISAAPTTGTWSVGDMLRNSNPTAGGQGHFLCIGAGTPGTWVYS